MRAGEQQRLAWARLLVARPRLALLDEATSALDQATEAELYAVRVFGAAPSAVPRRELLGSRAHAPCSAGQRSLC